MGWASGAYGRAEVGTGGYGWARSCNGGVRSRGHGGRRLARWTPGLGLRWGPKVLLPAELQRAPSAEAAPGGPGFESCPRFRAPPPSGPGFEASPHRRRRRCPLPAAVPG